MKRTWLFFKVKRATSWSFNFKSYKMPCMMIQAKAAICSFYIPRSAGPLIQDRVAAFAIYFFRMVILLPIALPIAAIPTWIIYTIRRDVMMGSRLSRIFEILVFSAFFAVLFQPIASGYYDRIKSSWSSTPDFFYRWLTPDRFSHLNPYHLDQHSLRKLLIRKEFVEGLSHQDLIYAMVATVECNLGTGYCVYLSTEQWEFMAQVVLALNPMEVCEFSEGPWKAWLSLRASSVQSKLTTLFSDRIFGGGGWQAIPSAVTKMRLLHKCEWLSPNEAIQSLNIPSLTVAELLSLLLCPDKPDHIFGRIIAKMTDLQKQSLARLAVRLGNGQTTALTPDLELQCKRLFDLKNRMPFILALARELPDAERGDFYSLYLGPLDLDFSHLSLLSQTEGWVQHLSCPQLVLYLGYIFISGRNSTSTLNQTIANLNDNQRLGLVKFIIQTQRIDPINLDPFATINHQWESRLRELKIDESGYTPRAHRGVPLEIILRAIGDRLCDSLSLDTNNLLTFLFATRNGDMGIQFLRCLRPSILTSHQQTLRSLFSPDQLRTLSQPMREKKPAQSAPRTIPLSRDEVVRKAYETLGLPQDSSRDAVKNAYRQLSMQHHPDRHSTASESEKKAHEERFKEMANAYQVFFPNTST
jgi:hypothetical protein